MIRRLLALVSGLAMLHLTLVGQLPCAPDSATAPAHSMDGMEMDAMPTADAHVAAGHTTPGQPAAQRCCEAMSSCVVSITVAAVTRVVASAHLAGGIPISDHAALLSFQTAPEPPPPKA